MARYNDGFLPLRACIALRGPARGIARDLGSSYPGTGIRLRRRPRRSRWDGRPVLGRWVLAISGKEREYKPVVKLRVRAGESIQEAVRRFRKLCERSGLRKEMRRKAYYEKPSERRRR